jgi:hypothetical protein
MSHWIILSCELERILQSERHKSGQAGLEIVDNSQGKAKHAMAT